MVKEEDGAKSRRVVLGVTGGIAAYKTAELVRLLTKKGYDVVPIMTKWATRFLGPLTLESLTGHPVRIETPSQESSQGIEHISLIRSAELLLVAPLTANTMAKMANGLADNFLTATYLAHHGKTLVCPAMNTAMLAHHATRRNMARLADDGVAICMGEAGDLACGEVGAGRMAEPDIILEAVDALLGERLLALTDRHVLISAGPTREDLDPVRYLSNRSSGKMGFALARAFRDAGARVTLVHGPVTLPTPSGLESVPVRTAAEMAEAILPRQHQMDVIIMAAAVADYRPPKYDEKLKKHNFDGTIRMERTTDILAALGATTRDGQILAGFAAETEAVLEGAKEKLKRKNLDFIFANDISAESIGFASDHNHIVALDRDEKFIDLGTDTKENLARAIVSLITTKLR